MHLVERLLLIALQKREAIARNKSQFKDLFWKEVMINPIGMCVAYQHKISSQSSGLVYKLHLRFSFKYDIQAANHNFHMPLN